MKAASIADIETADIKTADVHISRSVYDRDCCQSTNEKHQIRLVSANRALNIPRVDDQQDRRLLNMMKTEDRKPPPGREDDARSSASHILSIENFPGAFTGEKKNGEILCGAKCREAVRPRSGRAEFRRGRVRGDRRRRDRGHPVTAARPTGRDRSDAATHRPAPHVGGRE